MLRVVYKKLDNKSEWIVDESTKFAVTRQDGTIIKKFNQLYEAQIFSKEVDKTYYNNGLRHKSLVIII